MVKGESQGYMDEREIILFNIDRKFKNHGKNCLEKLEAAHIYIKSLENVLIRMGINEEKYSNSEFQFLKDRKAVLGMMNDSIRELEQLISGFDIKLGGNRNEKNT